jgi:TolB-like protein
MVFAQRTIIHLESREGSVGPMMQCLDDNSRARLDALCRADPHAEQAVQQLARVLRSRRFVRFHQQTKNFLAFVVAHKLLGQVDQIKETTIAVFVYGEPSDLSTAETCKVRVAASKLRRQLRLYNENEGAGDPFGIALPAKGYVPEIFDRRISVAITLENWTPGERHDHVTSSIGDELIDRLNEAGWIQARTRGTPPSHTAPVFAVRGSLEIHSTLLRVNLSVGEASSGRILYSQQFEDERERAFVLARRIADALIRVFVLDRRSPTHAQPLKPQPARASLRRRKRLRRVS